MDSKKYKELLHSVSVPSSSVTEEKSTRYKPLVDFLQTEIPSKLYRYRSCGELSFDAFAQDRIWFSKAKEMNDDFDALISYDAQTINKQLTEVLQRVLQFTNAIRSGGSIPEQISQIVPQMKAIAEGIQSASETDVQTRFEFGASSLREYVQSKLTPLSELLQDNIKIACFSESIASASMWGHYADNSRGFALAYDFRDFKYPNCCKNNSPCSHGGFQLFPVVYNDTRFDATEYISWLLQQLLIQGLNCCTNEQKAILREKVPCPDEFMASKIVLHKSSEWASEREWRMTYICLNPDIQSQEHSFGIKKPVAIYLGRKIKPINEKILLFIAKEKDVPVYKMEIDTKTYTLRPKLVQDGQSNLSVNTD